jgi:CxxC-x17-CxxC domain-containing protein
MGNFNRDDRSAGGYRSGFSRGGSQGFSRGGRSSFGGGRGEDREMFTATCSNCGKECQVPFRPTNGKPVYCSDCFEKMGGRDRQSSDRPRFEDRSRAPQAQGGPDLSAINAKLDKILNILEPKVVAPVTPAPVTKVEKTKSPEPVERVADKVDLTKIKKAIKKVASTKKK